MKENNIEELKQMLEELYRTQQARLDVGADDLDIREEIAEVEEEIKELQDETMEENSIEPQFTEEQIEYVKKILKEEVSKLIVDMQNNYIPKILVERMLKVAKEQKLKCDTRVKETFIDGAIFAFEKILEEIDK